MSCVWRGAPWKREQYMRGTGPQLPVQLHRLRSCRETAIRYLAPLSTEAAADPTAPGTKFGVRSFQK